MKRSDDWTQGWDYEAWAEHVRDELVPMVQDTMFTMSLVPSDGTFGDIKFAVELGVSIMLDKPIIAMVRPGTPIPNKLVQVCDRIVEIDFDNPTRAAEIVSAAIQELTEELRLNTDK